MKRFINTWICVAFAGLLAVGSGKQSFAQAEAADNLSGKYFGETPPGRTAELFLNGDLVQHPSGEKRSFNVAFAPDGKEMFFSYYKATSDAPHPEYEIKTYRLLADGWTGPETAPYSGIYSDVDINYAPDGKTVFFASDRQQPNSADLDIYYSLKTRHGWSEPTHAGAEINSNASEVYPSISAKGNMFFRSKRKGGFSPSDIYRAQSINGKFVNVKNLGPNVNSPHGQSNAVVAADESYLLLCTSRPETGNIQHIYVSFQTGENIWTKAISIGPEVNTDAGAGAPTLSPDGKYLFFKKTAEPARGLYWISTDIINNLKRDVLDLE